jgi:hypothetical protein
LAILAAAGYLPLSNSAYRCPTYERSTAINAAALQFVHGHPSVDLVLIVIDANISLRADFKLVLNFHSSARGYIREAAAPQAAFPVREVMRRKNKRLNSLWYLVLRLIVDREARGAWGVYVDISCT